MTADRNPSDSGNLASKSMYTLVKWLLCNADDRSSADADCRNMWKAKSEELRQCDYDIYRRLQKCLAEYRTEVPGCPEQFVPLVIYGFAGKVFETAGMILDDGMIVDEIYRDGRAQFLVWKDGKHEFVNKFERDGVTFVPIDDALLQKDKILLPSGIEDYGNASKLLEDIVAFITRWVETDPTLVRLCALQKMTEWLYEKVPVLPIINPRGGADCGKTRMGNALWQISFRGMRADGVLSLSSLFRSAEKWHGTIYVNEADIEERGRSDDNESSQLVKFYNSRYERGAAVWRTDKETLKTEVFDSYGPTILVTRKGFRDDALESRCLVVPMFGRTRTDILLNLPPEFDEEGQHLRNCLEYFRLQNLVRFSNDFSLEFEGVSTRMNQILQPMASLAKAHLPGFFPQVASIAHDLSERIVEQRASSEDGLIVRAYFAADPRMEGRSASDIAEMIKELFGADIKPERIGRRARSLGFEAFRSGGSAGRLRLLRLCGDHAIRMLYKYVPADEREEYRPVVQPEPQKLLADFDAAQKAQSTSCPSPSVPSVPIINGERDSGDGRGRLGGTPNEKLGDIQ